MARKKKRATRKKRATKKRGGRRRKKERCDFRWVPLFLILLGVLVGYLIYVGVQSTGSAIGDFSDTCSDSDAGTSVFTSGAVTGVTAGQAYSYPDACVGGNLREWFCAGSIPVSQDHDCATVGSPRGACQSTAQGARCV